MEFRKSWDECAARCARITSVSKVLGTDQKDTGARDTREVGVVEGSQKNTSASSVHNKYNNTSLSVDSTVFFFSRTGNWNMKVCSYLTQ